MGVYVITGGTTGIGAEVRRLLLEEGHEVLNIDYKGGDFEADLSTDEGVDAAIRAVEEKYAQVEAEIKRLTHTGTPPSPAPPPWRRC